MKLKRKERKTVNAIVLDLMNIAFMGSPCDMERSLGRMECAFTTYEKYKKYLESTTVSAVEEMKQHLVKKGIVISEFRLQ